MAMSHEEAFTIEMNDDWRTPYFMYLIKGILPTNPKVAYKMIRMSRRYFIEGGILFRKGFVGEPLQCLGLVDSQKALQEAHSGNYGEHQGGRKLYGELLNIGYYWPKMQKDVKTFVKRCHAC